MTDAPSNLEDARELVLRTLEPHGLDPAEVGIVGDPAHRGGYHCGSDRVVSDDYSVVESSRDRSALTAHASALDVGTFSVSIAGKRHDLPSFSVWCVAQCRAGTPDAADIREIIYSPDGKTVRRWDRLGRRTTGDSSHLIHTHFSFFRDCVKAGRDVRPLFTRYFTEIGLIKEGFMAALTDQKQQELFDNVAKLVNTDRWKDVRVKALTAGDSQVSTPSGVEPVYPNAAIKQLNASVSTLAAQVAALAGKDFTDEPAIVAGVLAGLDPAAIARAIPEDLAQQVADELAARLTRANPPS